MNKDAEKVLKRLRKQNKTYTIRISGDEENKVNSFAILMDSGQGFTSAEKETYYGITKKTIDLLKEAKIKFKILED